MDLIGFYINLHCAIFHFYDSKMPIETSSSRSRCLHTGASHLSLGKQGRERAHVHVCACAKVLWQQFATSRASFHHVEMHTNGKRRLSTLQQIGCFSSSYHHSQADILRVPHH